MKVVRSRLFRRGLCLLVIGLYLAPVGLFAQATTNGGTTTGPAPRGGTVTQPAPRQPAQPGPRVPQAGQDFRIPFVDLNIRSPQNNREVALSVQLLLVLAVLSLAPSFIIMLTSFLRVSIVFDFVKRALSLQSVPPTQVLLGISLFLTLFIMWPTFNQIYKEAYVPFQDGQIGIEEAYSKFEGPLRAFMYKQMAKNPEPIRLFMKLSNQGKPNTLADVPTYVIVPAFILNEMTVAFKIGILIFIPFVIIDMVVASILMSMGMIMLPPVMISMPFKLILFVLVDGWTLLTQQLVTSFA